MEQKVSQQVPITFFNLLQDLVWKKIIDSIKTTLKKTILKRKRLCREVSNDQWRRFCPGHCRMKTSSCSLRDWTSTLEIEVRCLKLGN